jgi:hypothetical protein
MRECVRSEGPTHGGVCEWSKGISAWFKTKEYAILSDGLY